jgi:FkbM family methyltransferase
MLLNELANVHLHRVGLADEDAELILHSIDKPNQGLGTFSTANQYDLPLRPLASCQVKHGARYLSQIGVQRIDAVKIDVQGFEPEVLRGLGEVLARDRPVIWCEMGARTVAEAGTTDKLSKLLPFSFRCFQLLLALRGAQRSCVLEERIGELPTGDYVLVPE